MTGPIHSSILKGMQKKSILVITDNISGFMAAHYLQLQGHEVTLVDTDNQPRAADRFQRLGCPFYRNTSQFRHGIRTLSDILTSAIEVAEISLEPKTFQDHELRPFVGFGDSKSLATHPLTHFNSSEGLRLSKTENEIVSNLLSAIKFKWISYAEVTALHFNQSTLEKITINGQQDLVADEFLFLTAPRDWLSILPHEVLGSRTRARLSKCHYFSRIALEFTHAAPVSTDENIFILTPTGTEHSPCAGRFLMQSHAGAVLYKSVWETYLSSDRLEDSEFVAAEIKNIRKMVRKAFPNFDLISQTEKPHEVLTINPFAHSDLQWVYEQKDLHEIAKNMLIYPTLAANSLGFMQSVECFSWAIDRIAALEGERASTSKESSAPTLLS